MDAQLKELIEKIKNDGVASAEQEADVIKQDAEKEAARIIRDAEEKATKIKDNAEKEANKLRTSGAEAVKQSSRNLILELKKKIEDIFQALIKEGTAKALTGDSLKDCIVAMVNGWSKNETSDLSVLVPEKELKKIDGDLKSALKDKINKGLDIKPFNGIEAGFRISVKDGSLFYDFSEEEISEMLSIYLSPSLAELIK